MNNLIEQKDFDAMVVMDPKYKAKGIEKVSEIISTGEELVKIHGEENLNSKLTEESEFEAVGAYFEYKLAKDTSI